MMFPPNYLTSRTRFREAAERLGWSLSAHPLGGTGPQGEELSIDAAISPNADVDRVLVVSSGLHGVEAPFGAAVQLAAMDRWKNDARPPEGVRCVFVHALNPYGFAWGRRFDAQNIDPNRNFLLPGESYSGSPDGYKDFDALLNPKQPPSRWDFFPVRAWWLVQRYGLPALKQALVVGQYEYPQGIFFGGHGPCATHVALGQRLREWIGQAAKAIHLDFHSGLGRYGSYKLLLDIPLTASLTERMDRWFGAGNYEEDNPNGVAYLPRGSFGPWCVAQRLAEKYLYLVAEFGTFGSVPMMAGVRAENQAHHWGRPDGANERRSRSRLCELFCPADAAWRRRVLNQGLELVQRAAAALGGAWERERILPVFSV
jgi:hypothetical protein